MNNDSDSAVYQQPHLLCLFSSACGVWWINLDDARQYLDVAWNYLMYRCININKLSVLYPVGKCTIKRQLYKGPFTLKEAIFIFFSTNCTRHPYVESLPTLWCSSEWKATKLHVYALCLSVPFPAWEDLMKFDTTAWNSYHWSIYCACAKLLHDNCTALNNWTYGDTGFYSGQTTPILAWR